MAKLMFVTPRLPQPPRGGRALLSQLHLDCLHTLYGGDLILEELDPAPPAGIAGRVRSLNGAIDGISPQAERRIIERVRREAVAQVYLNGSNLGRLAGALKRDAPGLEVCTFFHNVEARFFLGSLRQHPGVRALGVLIANYLAERSAVRWSDRLIALSARDGEGLRRLYGRAATDIVPMAIEDQLGPETALGAEDPGDYLLFVGGAFYANVAGISWFVDKVVPHIGLRTCIVGHGFEPLRSTLERGEKTQVAGGVERLDGWYGHAVAAVAPIFDGSGMKTKVAEALMFGKRILGTREAFSGYEAVATRAGTVCETAEDFISAIRDMERRPPPAFDPALRALYEEHNSRQATERRLAAILGKS